jgi:hypothetical protein
MCFTSGDGIAAPKRSFAMFDLLGDNKSADAEFRLTRQVLRHFSNTDVATSSNILSQWPVARSQPGHRS